MSELFAPEPEPPQHGGDSGVDVVPTSGPEGLLGIAVALEHLIVLGRGNVYIAEPSLEFVHLPVQGEQVVECFTGFFE